jgi:hypothetical protein
MAYEWSGVVLPKSPNRHAPMSPVLVPSPWECRIYQRSTESRHAEDSLSEGRIDSANFGDHNNFGVRRVLNLNGGGRINHLENRGYSSIGIYR